LYVFESPTRGGNKASSSSKYWDSECCTLAAILVIASVLCIRSLSKFFT
jgi:hypothetical protein